MKENQILPLPFFYDSVKHVGVQSSGLGSVTDNFNMPKHFKHLHSRRSKAVIIVRINENETATPEVSGSCVIKWEKCSKCQIFRLVRHVDNQEGCLCTWQK